MIPVILNNRLHTGLPENTVLSLACSAGPGGLHAKQLRVLKLNEQSRTLAEVSPNSVVDHVKGWRTAGPQVGRARV